MQMGQIAMAMAQKYQPELVQQIGMLMQGIMTDINAGGNLQQGGGTEKKLQAPADNMSAPNPNENALVARAKERSANASRPS